jgi:hypothetical protein
MQSFGLEFPSSTCIFGAIAFGQIGLVAFRRGRRAVRRATLWLGVALMVYPYAISRTRLLYAGGVALCAGIYLDRRA